MSPPISSMGGSGEMEEISDEQTIDVAFQVLNDNDDLKASSPSLHHLVGNDLISDRSVIKPLPSRDHASTIAKHKPNVIVYPTRRNDEHYEPSHGNGMRSFRNKRESSTSTTTVGQNTTPDIADIEFSKTLDAKLRHLQQQEKRTNHHAVRSKNLSPSIHSGSSHKLDDSARKPFVTVVKKGTFLKPPPELAVKLLLEPENDNIVRNAEKVYQAKRLYAYVSRPKVVNSQRSTHDSAHHKNHIVNEAAYISASIAGLTRIKRDNAGQWKVQNNPEQQTQPANIMFDKRVCRGNTYALPPMAMPKWNPNFGYAKTLSQGPGGESEAARQAEARRRAMARKKVKDKAAYAARLRLGSPPPVKGRKHEPVQTELYLEEIFEHPETSVAICQTDLFVDRPKSPFYYPRKVGVDVATQIYPGDLFDFDLEVQPILEVLVGKTIEQALIEVLEEEELAALREQARRFEEIRNSDCAEAQRLEERERRHRQEKDRRLAEHAEGARIQQETEERIAASVLMQGYIADLLPSVLEGLKEDGFVVDNMKAEVDDNFMPWLMKEVTQEMENMVSSRDILTDIVKELIETRHEIYQAMADDEEPKDESESEEEEGNFDPNDPYGIGIQED